MKKITFLLLLLPAIVLAQVTLTQNTNNTIVPGVSTGCAGGGGTYTTENNYGRLFNLSTLGYSNFEVTRISFGVETLSLGTATEFEVAVEVYSSTSGTTPTGLAFLGGQIVALTAANSGQMVSVDLTTPVSVGTQGMFINLVSPTGLATTTKFLIGANSNGQTAAGYLFGTCTGGSMYTFAGAGAPNTHIILNVTGNATLGADSFSLEKGTSVSPNPAVNQLSITVPNGEEFKGATLFSILGKEVLRSSNATFDVSSLQAGVYFANIEIGNTTIVKKIIKN